jgi:hypothetical protein
MMAPTHPLARAGLLAALLAPLCFFASACATKRPVLYPNAKLEAVGESVAKSDIDACLELAASADLEKSKSAETAKSTATGAAVGGAAGAAGGAIMGSAGRGAGAGAAVGAVGGLARGLFSSSEPDPLFKNYVDICLRERGYQTIGWK